MSALQSPFPRRTKPDFHWSVLHEQPQATLKTPNPEASQCNSYDIGNPELSSNQSQCHRNRLGLGLPLASVMHRGSEERQRIWSSSRQNRMLFHMTGCLW